MTAPDLRPRQPHELSVGNLVIGGTTGTPTLLTTIVSLDPIHFFFNVSEGDGMAYKRLVEKGEIPSARDRTVEVAGAAHGRDQLAAQGHDRLRRQPI